MTVKIRQGWTLEAVAFCGPDTADDWQVVRCHRDGTYLVTEDREGESRQAYKGPNLDASVELYLHSVRKLTMEALGVAYSDGTEERER